MNIPLRILIIEDSDRDVALEVRAIEAAGYEVAYTVAETAAEMKAALIKQAFDIVLSDHALPQFDAPGALAVLKQSGLDIPFIVVSGVIGEEAAVALMKAGANDYIMKDRISRLVPAIQKELREAESRRELYRAGDLVAESEERYRRIFETATDGIVLLEKSGGRIVRANPSVEKMMGYSAETSIGKRLRDIGVPLDFDDFPAVMESLRKSGILNYDDVLVKTRSGKEIYADIYLVDKAKLAQCNIRDVSERKLAETALYEEKKFIQNALDTLKDTFFVLDLEGRLIRWNKSMNDVTGYTDSELALMKIFDFIREEDKKRISETILEGMKKGSAVVEALLVIKGGRKIPYEFSAVLLRNKQGDPIGISGVGRDITERKKAESALQESEQRFHALFSHMSSGVAVYEAIDNGGDFIIRDFNHAAEKIENVNRKDILGKRVSEIFPGVKAFGAFAAFQRVWQTGETEYLPDKIYKDERNPGSWRECWVFKLPTGEIVALYNEITARKQAKEELQAALVSAHEGKTRAEAIMTSMGEGLSIQDTDFIITYQNKIQKDFVGDHVGEHCYTAYENKDHVCEGCPVAMAFRDGGIHKAERVVAADGKDNFHVEICASPLRDMQGNIVAGIEVIRDVSGQKKIEAQLRQSQKMEAVGTLAGGIAHDFNNILNVIMGYGVLVMNTLDAGSPAMEDMNEVLSAAERAADLTKRLLVFSRKQVVEMRYVNINELILGLRKLLVQVIRENITLNLDLADRPLIVLADAGGIEQVLMNLAANAKDAMPEVGRLTISTELEEVDEEYVAAYGYGKPGRFALITVADTGQGMDAETQKKIFEPFFTTKDIGKGTGLGLGISYGIIKQHGGYIKVYSEPGQGSVFKIYLPLGEEATSPDKKTDAATSVKGGNETVLVAEDDASLRKLTRTVLESFGYSVISAEDGEDAIAKFLENRERISLVLLDMIMPKKSGKEASAAIIKVDPRMKILLASGYVMDNITSRELAEAGFDFINKPFRPKDLLIKVREVLDR